MPTLLDVPTADERQLLEVVAKCFHTAEDQWPVWQYIDRQFAKVRPDIDATEVLRGMPTWKHGYRYLRVDNRGEIGPEDSAEVRMTIAGIHHSGNGRLGDLADAFVVALRESAKRQASAEPEPRRAVAVAFQGSELTQLVHQRSGVPIPTLTLSGFLESEPATGRGLEAPRGIAWVWHLENVRLNQFRQIQTVEEYLIGLERIVGLPETVSPSGPLPPAAVAEAFDHLNLAWHRATGEDLLVVKRAMIPAVLTQSVASADEFQSRCSALSSLLNSFTTGVKANKATKTQYLAPMLGLKHRLEELLNNPSRALSAVDDLRNIISLRTGQQHPEQDKDQDAGRARIDLGLAGFGNDWAGAWEHLRHKIVETLRIIREELDQ
jgi:hypothetical protein